MSGTVQKIWRSALTAACLVAGCALPAPNPPAAPLAAAPNKAQGVLLPTVTPEGAQSAAPAPLGDLTPDQAALLAILKNHGPAPELFNETWLNTAPLKLADLRGKVVMLEFWTFG